MKLLYFYDMMNNICQVKYSKGVFKIPQGYLYRSFQQSREKT